MKPNARDITRAAMNAIARRCFNYDRRQSFHDVSKIASMDRRAASPIVQFYSSADNIGNLLPVLGIREMLGRRTDTWCAHDDAIDFDFINRHYNCAIIGGAGLLHSTFQPFWSRLARECRLPMIIWGVGPCMPDDEGASKVDPRDVTSVTERCDLINLRDELAIERYDLKEVHVSACPTIVHLRHYERCPRNADDLPLFASHPGLVKGPETRGLKRVVRRVLGRIRSTDNIQQRYFGLGDIISRYYCRSRRVVTTRLHGAIIAYGLGIPYVIIPRDEKLRAFCRLYGNGISVDSGAELNAALRNRSTEASGPIAIAPVLQFGRKARDWVESFCGSEPDAGCG